MPHSFASLLVHIVFSTKDRVSDLSPGLAARLFPYMRKHGIEYDTRDLWG
jgi:hypothetical protein